MQKYFKNNETQLSFEKNGYVVLDLLEDSTIFKFKKLYQRVKPLFIWQTFSNIYSCEKEINKSISNNIHAEINNKIEDLFCDCDFIAACFISKGTGNMTKVNLHQDWMITDEEKYFSLALWIPLQDTDVHNGAITLIKGSHKWFKTIRSHQIPSVYVNLKSILQEKLETIKMKKGQVLVYAQNIFHGSWSNQSFTQRVAVNITVMHKNAPRLFFFQSKDKAMSAYKMPDDFHFDMIAGIKNGKYPSDLTPYSFDFSSYKYIDEIDVIQMINK